MAYHFRVGQTVEYTGLSEPAAHCMYGDHFRVTTLMPHGASHGDGRFTMVGDWVECFGGIIGRRVIIPARQLRPVAGRCWCDVCDADA